MSDRGPTSPDPYTPASWSGVITMLVIIAIGIAVVWWAFANAMDSDWAREQFGEDVPIATIAPIGP